MSDIKQRLLDESFKGQEAMRREALARIEALEAQLAESERENGILRDVMMNPDTDSEPDVVRLHREKCDEYMKRIEIEAQLAAAREALEKIGGDREYSAADIASHAQKPHKTIDESVAEGALASLPAPEAAPTREDIARIIDPSTFAMSDHYARKGVVNIVKADNDKALAKADAILALKAAPAK